VAPWQEVAHDLRPACDLVEALSSQTDRIIRALQATMECRLMTAFGSPVDPEVIMKLATVSGVSLS
jgi:hypothetical protein